MDPKTLADAHGIDFTVQAVDEGASPTLPDGQQGVPRDRAIRVALDNAPGVDRAHAVSPNVEVSAQYGLFTRERPGRPLWPNVQNLPVWVITFSGPGVVFYGSGGPPRPGPRPPLRPEDAKHAAGYAEDLVLQPLPYKIYETLAPLPLPRDVVPSPLPGLVALARTGGEPQGESIPACAMLARLALLSNGLLDRRVTSARTGKTVEFRTAGSTGALYHLELYVVCADLPDLEAGVYHYGAHDHSLRQLRAGDYRGILVAASGGAPALVQAPAVLAVTSTFWRNAWYYRGRAYRHAYWDAGTALAQALAIAAAWEVPTRLVLGYADAAVNELLAVDGVREATVALCTLGRTHEAVPSAPALPPLDYPTRPLSLLGLLPKQAGEIRWNGQIVEDPAAWFVPPRCAYTPQVPHLFSETLRDNGRADLLAARQDIDQ